GLGVKRHAPRLAARQRGILAFMPLTVVGPGRLHSGRRGCPSTARGQRLRKSFARRCRSRSPPTERLRKAPLETWIGMDGRIITLQVKSSGISLREYFF